MTSMGLTDPAAAMTEDDYLAPAEIFISQRFGGRRRGLGYHRFSTSVEAIGFAVEEFPTLGPDGLVMAVEDKRFNLGALRILHRADGYRSHLQAAETSD